MVNASQVAGYELAKGSQPILRGLTTNGRIVADRQYCCKRKKTGETEVSPALVTLLLFDGYRYAQPILREPAVV